MSSVRGKTIIVTGSSRGVGREIALRCAREGANLVVASKSASPHPRLEGTIFSVAKEIESAGGRALPVQLDVRSEAQIQEMIAKTVATFGGIDVIINNAGAVVLLPVEKTTAKHFDLVHQVNIRGSFLCITAALPYLKEAENPHILNLSPPVSLEPKWFVGTLAYTLTKFGLTMVTIGMSEELEKYGISVNSLWPRTLIATAAIPFLLGDEAMKSTRKPSIMADAAYAIITTPGRKLTGQSLLDEDFLRSRGETNFDKYASVEDHELLTDFYVDYPLHSIVQEKQNQEN